MKEKAAAKELDGLALTKVDAEKFRVEAEGIHQKAEAMKKLDGVGKEHGVTVVVLHGPLHRRHKALVLRVKIIG